MFATFSIAMFSAVGIALTFVQKQLAPQTGSELDSYLTILAVCIGLFVGVISLLEWGSSGSIKAEALHHNAELLNSYQRKVSQTLAAAGQPDEPAVTRLREEYEAIKAACPHNHEPSDDELFTAQHRLSPKCLGKDGVPRMSWLEAKLAFIADKWSSAKIFLVFWVVIVGLLATTPWSG